MGYLYILESLRSGKFYIGSTTNLGDRIGWHFAGRSKTTKNMLPVICKFVQKFEDIKEARQTEYWLKKQKDKKLIERIIAEGKITKKF